MIRVEFSGAFEAVTVPPETEIFGDGSGSSRVSVHALTVASELPPENRLPEFQTVVSDVREWRLDALEPIPLLPEVQKGIISFPEKS